MTNIAMSVLYKRTEKIWADLVHKRLAEEVCNQDHHSHVVEPF